MIDFIAAAVFPLLITIVAFLTLGAKKFFERTGEILADKWLKSGKE